jgi:hypothetical protein
MTTMSEPTKTTDKATTDKETNKATIVAETLGIVASQPTAPEEVDTTVNPLRKWTPEVLGAYVAKLGKKDALDIWRMGRAMNYAHAQVKHGKWKKWQEEWVPFYSEKTIERYRKVGELLYDDVKDLSVDEVYRTLFGEDYARKKPKEEPPVNTGGSSDKPKEEPPVNTGEGAVEATIPTTGEPATADEDDEDEGGVWDSSNYPPQERLEYSIFTLNAVMDYPDEGYDDLEGNKDNLFKLSDRLQAFLIERF